jgi:tetratricopeptide (TPR) repeat protein
MLPDDREVKMESRAYDLFISYARRDNEQGRITQLVERIELDFAPFASRQLVPFFDQQEINGMQDWRQRILQGLRESRLLLACLSPSYLKSEYCEWEFIEYLKYEIGHLHGFNGIAPIYFVNVPGWDDKDFDQRCAGWVAELRQRQNFDLRPWYDQGEEALREAAVRERMGKLNHQIAETILRGERAEKSLGNVDAHNPHFIGRMVNLRLLRENFVKPGNIGVIAAVNGVGGLGKTALAIEYAHAFADEYGGGRWQVRCAGKDDLRLALAELATPMGFEFTDDEKKNADLQFERTRRELKKLADARAPHRCLLLLDNMDRPGLLDPAQVARLNAGDWLHVLATTRLGENELHGAHRDRSFLAVDELPPDDALALIESYQPDGHFRSEAERDAARVIVRSLGCFTLAVESAAVYLGQFAHDVTCAGFLARLRKEGLEGLDAAAGQSSEGVLHGEKRLGATLQPTLERLGKAEKLALEFAALLPPDQVALPWLRALAAMTFPEIERDAEPGYPDAWKNVLRRLFSLRLFQATDVQDADGQPRVVRVHRLVQELVRSKLREEATQKHHAVFALAIKRSEHLDKHWHEPDQQWEISPLLAFLNQLLDSRDSEAPTLVKWVSQWLTFIDTSMRPELLLRRALAQQEADTQTDPREIAITLSNLALVLNMQARFAEAEPLLRKALAIDEKYREPTHKFIAIRLHNLGLLLQDTNRVEEAEPLHRRALAIEEKCLGADHPAVATSLNSLAYVLHHTNRLAEVEPLIRRALAIWEKSLGPDHPHVASGLNNLAGLLKATNRLKEAEPLYRRALAIDERSLGPDHPSVATSLNNLATLLQATNRLGEAEALYRRALAIDERSFGPQHPNVAVHLSNLATLLYSTKRLGEAEGLFQRALAIWEESLGADDPHVARALGNLAFLLQASVRMTEAEPLLRRALTIREKSFGADHPDVAMSLNNLASLLQDTNRLAEAEPLYRRALAIYEKSPGADHPDVALSLNNLASLLQATNRLGEAEALYRRALAIREKALVPGHPKTLQSLESLATLLESMGRTEEAVPLREQALECKLGPEHPDTLRSWNNRSHALRKQGHADQAEPIDRQLVAATAKVLGKDHRLTIHRRNNLVLTLIMLGKLAEARGLLIENWQSKAEPFANTTPRVVFLAHLLALLESQSNTPFLGQLKALLSGPELSVAQDVAVPWDNLYFTENLRPQLPPDSVDFLTALVAAMNDRAKLPDLDRFPEWRNQLLISLDTPWPSE